MAIKAMLSGLFGIPLAWLASQCCSHASVGLLGDPLLEMFGIRSRGSPPGIVVAMLFVSALSSAARIAFDGVD